MRATLLLPAAKRFGRQRVSDDVARLLGRADRLPDAGEGRRALLARHFRLVPDHWPIAALTRQRDAGDAIGSAWLRADPCHVRPDINGARLLATGDTLALTREDADALLPVLQPLFGDAGFPIDAPVPSRWYLRMPQEAQWPSFAEPDDALGMDLFDHLPEGLQGRRWRTLLSEAQVVLHNHPWNARRMAQGKPAVNSLWFWGGGVLPDHVAAAQGRFHSDDEVASALAHAAGMGSALPSTFTMGEGDSVFDLVALRDLAVFERDWWQPAMHALQSGRIDRLDIESEDGLRLTLERRQHWRFWRKPRADFKA